MSLTEFDFQLPSLTYDPEIVSPAVKVEIGDQARRPKYTEAIEIPPNIVYQAQEIGNLLVPIADEIPDLAKKPDYQALMATSENYFRRTVQPFLSCNNRIGVFGIDSIIQSNGQIKIIEINSRPQFLGRYDLFNSNLQGENSNSNAYLTLKSYLESIYSTNGGGAIISHPLNAFHEFHQLLSDQTLIPIGTLQDVTIQGNGQAYLRDTKISTIFRQFSMNSLTTPSVTDPKIVRAIQEGELTIVNGPLAETFGQKEFLPLLHKHEGLNKYLPQMITFTINDKIELHDYKGWWLKTTTGGQTELTVKLTRDNLNSWVGKTLRSLACGNIESASEAIAGRNTLTALRFRKHIEDIRRYNPTKWILQKQVDPIKIKLNNGNLTEDYNHTLRIYFMRDKKDAKKPKVYMEILASKSDRVSGSGYTIPIRVIT